MHTSKSFAMNTWQSSDMAVSKEIIRKEEFTDKPTDRSACRIKISNVSVTRLTGEDLRTKLHSDILDESPEKTIVLGYACTKLDREIERAVKTMFINETSLISIRLLDENKFGTQNVIVKFQMTLHSFEPFKPIWNWSAEEKYHISAEYKAIGVCLFKDGRYFDAFHMFSKSCKILITLEPIEDLELEENLEKKIGILRIILYNNMAECQLSQQNYEHAITLCCKVLKKDENNVKALYRRGVAYGKLKNVEKAVEDLKKVLSIDPNNVIARAKYNLYNEQCQAANERYEGIVKRMFRYEK